MNMFKGWQWWQEMGEETENRSQRLWVNPILAAASLFVGIEKHIAVVSCLNHSHKASRHLYIGQFSDFISKLIIDNVKTKATLSNFLCVVFPPPQDMAGYKPKVISLTKRPGQTFGFYLRLEHGEEGHLVRCLEMGGPAELSGMKDGDRVIRVNGTFTDALSHSVVSRGCESTAVH